MMLGVVHNCKKLFFKSYHCVIFNILGAFGMVHKGEMIASDGTVKAMAIKTIKCKFCYNILLYNMWIICIASYNC